MIRWGKFYENGGAAGYTPREIKDMSLWEYTFALSGFGKFHSGTDEKISAPSEDEFERWMSLYGAPSTSIKADQ